MDRTPYRVVLRLTLWALENWPELDGRLLMKGVDLLSLGFSRQINVVYSLLLENRDEMERDRFERDLHEPLPGEEIDPDDPFWGDEAEASVFMSSMARTP